MKFIDFLFLSWLWDSDNDTKHKHKEKGLIGTILSLIINYIILIIGLAFILYMFDISTNETAFWVITSLYWVVGLSIIIKKIIKLFKHKV